MMDRSRSSRSATTTTPAGNQFVRHCGLLTTAILLQALVATSWAIEETSPPAAPPKIPPPPTVKLNKCCSSGEYLNEGTCIAGTEALWLPMVYMVQQQRFFEPHGGSPRFLKFLPNTIPTCRKDQTMETFRSRAANVMLFPNGTLYVRERALMVQPADYCVDWDVAVVCVNGQPANALEDPDHAANPLVQQEPPKASLRLSKCCGKWGSYNTQIQNCDLQSKHQAAVVEQLRLAPQLPEGSYETSYGLPDCAQPGGYSIAGDWQDAKLDRSTAMLQLPHKNLSAGQYCLEHTQREGEVKIIACQHLFRSAAEAGIPAGPSGGAIEQANGQNLQKAVLTGGILVSIVFLFATLVAGFLLPAVHHALHWRCQICYVTCLLFGKILLAVEELSSSLQPGSAACHTLAITMQFFFLAAFFWLNTMCFNIWWTFRDFRPSSLERNQEALRRYLYSLYAWGGPLLITFVAACVDQLPETTLLRPGFGQLYCWFDNRNLSIFAYFYGPIGLLLCANIALFVSTTHQLTCGLWKRDDVKSSSEKSALGRVCLKLVVVMGVTWIADILSWLVGGPHGVWFFTDLINALQGVFIFIVVGCQPQVWTACRRIFCPRLRHDITNTTNGVQHSSSSQGLPSLAAGTEITQNTTTTTTTTTTHMPSSPAAAADSGLEDEVPEKAPIAPAAPIIKMETVC
ncbi:probable G-protein coupled receptor Mth-like 1 [Drosophila santomea]|uniref:probable G-protein coupled receptor Mth-like 1 n=1 Tax=Drosophila santomea TaxID=129105 RepID=UPI001954A62D|nr:probable G-protein coupled receptor Mth-like 1 [Drosophila santomea]